jgi:hypothetical protein
LQSDRRRLIQLIDDRRGLRNRHETIKVCESPEHASQPTTTIL